MAQQKGGGLARKLLADALYNQGVSLLIYGEMLDAAEKTLLSALEFDAKHAPSLHNLGAIHDRRGSLCKAITFYERALKANSRHIECMQNLATAYQRCDRLEEASKLLHQLAVMDPANAGLYHLRDALLIRSIIPDKDYPTAVRRHMHASLDNCLKASLRGEAPERHAAPYFFLSYHGIANTDLHRKIALTYLHSSPSLAWNGLPPDHRAADNRRLRIGIASANLHNHSIGHTSRGLVEHLDRAKFEVVVIRLAPSPQDEMANAIDRASDQSFTVDYSNLARAREQIANLQLDILFYQDIGMEPFSYLLSFARLAPIQLTSFGHPDTTGVPNMDYFISSDLYEIEGAQAHYTEQLVLLPNAGTLSYYYKPEQPAAASRNEFGLDDDMHLYFCPQTLFKMHPDMDEVFFGILARDPLARIVLIEPAQTHMRQALEKRWKTRGSAGADRIVFIKRLLHADYLRLMSCADVMLDTVHFNGQNTNLEAFSLGIPVVTWPGAMQRERHTIGMYKAMGEESFSELIAASTADYAEKAVNVATDKKLRSDLQARIAQHCDVLYENMDFVRSCEAAFMQMANEKLRLA